MRTLSWVLILAVAAIATLAAHGPHHNGRHRSSNCAGGDCGSVCSGPGCNQNNGVSSNHCTGPGCRGGGGHVTHSGCPYGDCSQHHTNANTNNGNNRTAATNNSPDMPVIHFLFEQNHQITRRVNFKEDGIEAITESADPTVRAQLRSHVRAMKQRLEQRQPLRQWDPLFAEIFAHADQIRLDVFDTPEGVRIVETSTNPDVVRLIHAHAHAVSGFVTEGMSRMHQSHSVPTTGSR